MSALVGTNQASPTPTIDLPPSEKPVASPGAAPDGGFHAWATVAGCFLALFTQFGLANSFGVFQTYYEQNQLATYTSSEIAWIGALQQFILFFGGILIGRLYDGHGPHLLLIPGSFILVFSLMMTSLCHKYYQFLLAQGLLFGIGSSMIFHPCVVLPGQWFMKRRALAMAIGVSGSGLGGTLWPIALRRLFDEIGFAWAIRTVAFISAFFLVLANILIRTRLPRKPPVAWMTIPRQFKDTPYLLYSIGGSLVVWGLFTPFFFASSSAARLGADESLAFYCLAFINAGSTVGRLAAGAGDYVGRFNLMIIATTATSILLLGFWIPLNGVGALITFCVLYGFFAGMFISLISACIAQISSIPQIGVRAGATFGIMSFFALTGPPIVGALVAGYPGRKGFQMAGLFSGIVILVGVGFIIIARMMIDRKVLAKV